MEIELLNGLFVLKREKGSKATHIVFPSIENPRFLIDIRTPEAFRSLSRAITPYSMKMSLFKLWLQHGTLKMLKKFLQPVVVVSEALDILANAGILSLSDWFNVLIGSPGPHQKIILQILHKNQIVYMKLGAAKAKELITNEASTLGMLDGSDLVFYLPKVLNKTFFSNFSAIIFDEFLGKKQEPVVSHSILNVFQNIQNIRFRDLSTTDHVDEKLKLYKALIGKDVRLSFSHGDFAPWNMRKTNERLLLFDWEYSGVRFAGYDLIHYVFQVDILLRKKNWINALRDSIKEVQKKTDFLRDYSEADIELLYLKEREVTYQTDFDREIFKAYLGE